MDVDELLGEGRQELYIFLGGAWGTITAISPSVANPSTQRVPRLFWTTDGATADYDCGRSTFLGLSVRIDDLAHSLVSSLHHITLILLPTYCEYADVIRHPVVVFPHGYQIYKNNLASD